MKKATFKWIALSLCIIAVDISVALGQDADRFTLTGQIRHRTEFDARDFDADESNNRFHLLRTRVGLQIAVSSDISAFVQAQDARVFGGEDATRARGTLDGSAPALDLHQAYFSVQDLFGSPLTVQIGRQELAYGNQRLIGSVGWSNIGRSFDAGVLSYTQGTTSLDVFAAQLVGSTSRSEGQNLYGIYGTIQPDDQIGIDGFVFVDNDSEEIVGGPDTGKSMLERFTLGTRGHGKISSLDYELELIYQGGDIATSDSTARLNIKSYLLSGTLGYTFASNSRPRLAIQYTMLSGDEGSTDDELNAVNTLFATNHKFYGFMDFFPATLPQQGLQDIAGTLSLTASEKLRLRFDVHHFMLAQAVQDIDTYGQEIDLTANYAYNSQFNLQAGLSAFFPDEAMEQLRGGDAALWFYIMTTVNF